MFEKLTIKLVHLYPEEMNIYGDYGNVITLRKRCEWRGIEFTYRRIGSGKIDSWPDGDIYFMGGGQDDDMFDIFKDLIRYKKNRIRQEVIDGKVFLLICGAFQLFGREFYTGTGEVIKGLNLVPAETKAPGDKLKDRCLGNLISKLDENLLEEIKERYPGNFKRTLVGFENHSGQTYFTSEHIQPLGNVIYGKGNNILEKADGSRFENIFASYSHGSLLPKNPHLADLIISLALEKRYGKRIALMELDDEIEWEAHEAIVMRFSK